MLSRGRILITPCFGCGSRYEFKPISLSLVLIFYAIKLWLRKTSPQLDLDFTHRMTPTMGGPFGAIPVLPAALYFLLTRDRARGFPELYLPRGL
jgi:hypothetical protein